MLATVGCELRRLARAVYLTHSITVAPPKPSAAVAMFCADQQRLVCALHCNCGVYCLLAQWGHVRCRQAKAHTLEAKDELARVSAEIVGRFNRIDAFEEEWQPVPPLTNPACARSGGRMSKRVHAATVLQHVAPCCNMSNAHRMPLRRHSLRAVHSMRGSARCVFRWQVMCLFALHVACCTMCAAGA